MKILLSALAATLLYATSTLSLAGGPSFPGLPYLMTDPHVLGSEITQEEIQKQLADRQKLEEFAKKLKAWWWAENNPKPIPYVEFKGKKVRLPKKFLAAYIKAQKEKKLKQAWASVEKSLKSRDFLKKA